MLITLSITNASNVMQYFSRFTDDIFLALVSLIFVIKAGRSIGGDLFDGKLTQSEAWIGAEDNLTVIGPRSTIVTTANTPNGISQHRRHSHAVVRRSRLANADTFRDEHTPTAGMAPCAIPTS
jgi:hypothetical protein